MNSFRISNQISKKRSKYFSGVRKNLVRGTTDPEIECIIRNSPSIFSHREEGGRKAHYRSLGFVSELLSGHCPMFVCLFVCLFAYFSLFVCQFRIHIGIVEWTLSDVPREAALTNIRANNREKMSGP